MNAFLRAASVLTVSALALGSSTLGGEQPIDLSKPGPEHKLLASLEGIFEAKVKVYLGPSSPPEESIGIMKRKMIMGGLFLQELFEGKAMGQPFHGMGLIGFDTLKKKYTTVWIDTTSTGTMQSLGTYDAEKKTWIHLGEDINPMNNKSMKARDVFKIVNDKEQVMEMFRQPDGGKEFKMLEIHYTRKK